MQYFLGWSVTVAGAGQHMEMDVEMRLSFPKNKPSNSLMLTNKENPYFLEHKEEPPPASYFDQRVLPIALNRYASGGNPKRALTRVNTGELLIFKVKINIGYLTQIIPGINSTTYHLPSVNTSGSILGRQTASQAIKVIYFVTFFFFKL